MKRSKKLLSMLLVLVALMGATVVATKLSTGEVVEEDTSVVIFSLEPDTITAITWDYSEEVSFEKTDDGWKYTADSTFPLTESYLTTMVDTLTEITASKSIEYVEDWDQYTLEVPICRIQVTAGDTEYTIKIGEETSLTGERYCSIGDGNAYLVDADVLDAFSYGLYDVLKMEAIPDMSNIESMTLESDTQSYRIQYLEDSGLAYSDDYVWFLEGQALDTELTEALLDAVRDLEWTECAHFHVTDFAAYGLDEPAAVVSIDYVRTLQVDTGETDEEGNAIYETQSDEEAFILSLSEASNGYCYARIGDSAMVYKVDADVLDTLRYTTEAELQPDEVMLMDWENVNGFDITLNGEVYQITKGTETVTDDEGNTSEETVYPLNGEQIDGAAIEDALDKLTFSGYAAGLTPARSEEFRIVIHRDREIFSSVEFAIYQYDSSQCLVTRDGEATVLANRETVVDLVETVNSLVLG